MRRLASGLAFVVSLFGGWACGSGGDGSSGGQAVLLSPSPGVRRSVPMLDAPVQELAGSLNNAGFGLWRSQLADGNFVFSPASIGHTLLMARAAADMPTGNSIDQALTSHPGCRRIRRGTRLTR